MLGAFIIDFIQYMKLDHSVGYESKYLPQVYYIPDVPVVDDLSDEEYAQLESKYPIRELPSEEVEYLMKMADGKVAEFDALLRSGKFSL